MKKSYYRRKEAILMAIAKHRAVVTPKKKQGFFQSFFKKEVILPNPKLENSKKRLAQLEAGLESLEKHQTYIPGPNDVTINL